MSISEWGTWQPTIWEGMGMDPKAVAIVEGLLTNNVGDLFAIMNVIGVENMAKIAPHVINILKTMKTAQAPK